MMNVRHWPVLATAALLASVPACKGDHDEQPKPAEATAAAETAGSAQAPTEAEIDEAVERELSYDPMVPDEKVDVRTFNGVVELSGTVPYLAAKERATRIAKSVRGVRAVNDVIEVKPVERSDEEISKNIEELLRMDRATESYEVEPKVKDGVVTLTGQVGSWHERNLAGRLAKCVPGVRGVENDITFEYGEARTDPEIEADVKSRLRWDVRVDDLLIRVNVIDGVVKLSGTVGSVAEREQAENDAYVVGTRKVDVSGLSIEAWAKDEDLRKRPVTVVDPEAVEKAIKDAAIYDPVLKGQNVEPHFEDGVVTLRGKVDTLEAERIADRLARDTVGVHRVVNQLEVRPPTPKKDAELHDEIMRGLLLDAVTEAYEIDARVHKGDVELTGTVGSLFEKAEATQVAMRYVSDGTIENKIKVKNDDGFVILDPRFYAAYPDALSWAIYVHPKTPAADAEIEKKIEEELFWDPDVDDADVNVEVKDGKATLTGSVDSLAERLSAEMNALEAGATSVQNELKVG